MTPLTLKPFFETIYRLRNDEEVILFGKMSGIDPDEEKDVMDFLELEWDNECLEYPGSPPPFDAAAALWGARTIYLASQILLYREQNKEELCRLLEPYAGELNAAAMLSVDLCLRMMPSLLIQFAAIDPEDVAIPILKAHLGVWHYSGVGYKMPGELPDISVLLGCPTALQLYADRVIAHKDKSLVAIPGLSSIIQASMGDLAGHFWKG